MKDRITNNRYYPKISTPKWVSFFCTLAFFMIFLFLFHPGYGINDDLKMIWLVVGYPGSNPVPFLVHSNVLIGLILTPLYALHTMINWEILVFVAINFLSVWAFLYIFLSHASPFRQKLFGVMIILACDAYFILNITFTTIAAFACLSGICLILATSRSSTTLQKGYIASGTLLILIGSLIRLEVLLIGLSIVLPAAIITRGMFNFKNLVIALIAPCLFVLAGYAFNRVYLHFSPEWNAYNIYDNTRVLIHDTHRLENMHSEIRFIGWSSNDQELFARWFFPDQRTYSLGHLQYLVNNVSGASNDLNGPALAFYDLLISPGLIPYLLIFFSICLWMQFRGLTKKASLPLLAMLATCLAVNLYLAWAWKLADRTIYSSVVAAVVSGMLFVTWHDESGAKWVPHPVQKTGIPRLTFYCSVLIWMVALGLILNQAFLTSRNNIIKQTAYQHILTDLKALQTNGIISQNSLIISPGHGLPLEWPNPFILESPSIQYLDTAWITFSPSYEQVLQQFGIQSLTDALYQKNNIYLMTRSAFTVFLGRYYQEHENISVVFKTIYIMPNSFNFPGYDDVRIYKVVNQ